MKHSILLLLALLSLLSVSSSALQKFNVDSYGAKGDGASDSTKAFVAAWNAACRAPGAVEMYVPMGKYLVQPVTFEGKCVCSQLTVRIEGWLLGPRDYMVIAKAGRWITFEGVENLVIQGGTLRGRGEYLWQCKSTQENDPKCPFGGTMLSISKSHNVWVNNVTSVHSQGFHMTIEDSQNVHVYGATIIAPGNSPNTDGIHVATSTGITISSATIKTGDDCISLGEGSQNVWIEDVFCAPGHGISIGSLAIGPGESPVRNVTARDVQFYGTQNGYRIKTWAKPFQVTVSDIHFLKAVMRGVSNPIIIDQFYCPAGDCSTSQPSHAKISNVEFSNIHGNSASEVAIRLDCSPMFPCSGLSFRDISLSYAPNPSQSEVKNANVSVVGVVRPGFAGS